MRSAALAALLALALCPTLATAQAPLIYEGRLTTGELPPDPWPALRFAIVDADDAVWWSTVVEPGGPIEVGPDGGFVAYLESTPEAPLAVAGLDAPRWLRVDVCPGVMDAIEGCEWVRLEGAQRIGAAPVTIARGDGLIREDVMLAVGGDGPFASIQAALAWLDGRLILPGVEVTISVAAGNYPPLGQPPYGAPIVLERTDGRQIRIVGDVEAPENVLLRFGETPGLIVEQGTQLGWLNGVTLVGDRAAPVTYEGIYVGEAAFARLGPSVVVRGFTADCITVDGGDLFADGVTVDNCGDEGVQARNGARARTRGATATGNHEWGFAASTGSFLHCGDCISRDNRFEGFAAHDLSYVYARSSQTSGNRGGYLVDDAGMMSTQGAEPAAPRVGEDPSFIAR